MSSRRHPAIAFLWLAATSLGKITLTLPDHITVEQQTVIRWTRGAQDPVSNYGVRTVPSIDLEVRALHPDDKSRLSGTITVVFHESPTGLVVLEVLNKDNLNTVYTTSSPFNVFNTDGTTGSEGSSATLSRTATSNESATSTGLPRSDSTSSDPASSGSGSNPHVTARVIGAIVAGLVVLGLLTGIVLWLRQGNGRFKTCSPLDPRSSTIELRLLANEQISLNSRRNSATHLSRQVVSFASAMTTIPTPASVTLPSQNSRAQIQSMITPSMTDTLPADPIQVQSREPDEGANRRIEEMAAKVERMESEIVRLNQHLMDQLPPAYSSSSSSQ